MIQFVEFIEIRLVEINISVIRQVLSSFLSKINIVVLTVSKIVISNPTTLQVHGKIG